MNPTIQVTINPDGVSCREVNSLGEKAPRYVPLIGGWEVMVTESDRSIHFREKLNRWNEAEATLRTFEIAYVDCTCTPDDAINCQIPCGETHYPKGAILTAEILPNNKVKIIS